MMRWIRAAWVALLVGSCVPYAATSAHAEPTDGCLPTDPQLTEGSGLLVADDGFRVINDGGESVIVYRLDAQCASIGVTTSAIDPYDVEDLARGPDGSLWLADTGDNNTDRATIAVIVVPDQDGEVPGVLRRLTYPDGPHDAESMIVDSSGRAIVMTKTFTGLVGVYRSSAPLDLSAAGTSDPQPMDKLGELQLHSTGTAGGPVGPPISNLMSTGAAQCGSVVALRSYTDAYLWAIGPDGDPATAMLNGTPTVIALPVAAQGESIALSSDCQTLFTHGEGVGVEISAMSVPTLDAPAASSSGASADDEATGDRASSVWLAVALGGIAVLSLVALGWQLRRQRRGRAVDG